MVKATVLPRAFSYNGTTLPDIEGLSVEEIQQHYAHEYPELATASVAGPENKDGKMVYTFSRAIGTKG